MDTKAFCHNELTPLSINCLTDVRKIEILCECYSYLNDDDHIDTVQYHIDSAKTHIIKAIDNIEKSDLNNAESESINEEKISVSSYLPRLQFIYVRLRTSQSKKIDEDITS